MTLILRRAVMALGSAAVASLAARRAGAQRPGPPSPVYPFTLRPLPYAFGANEPHVDAQTMELHHDRHHAAYVANLNAAVKDTPQVAAMTDAHGASLSEPVTRDTAQSGYGIVFALGAGCARLPVATDQLLAAVCA